MKLLFLLRYDTENDDAGEMAGEQGMWWKENFD